MRIRSPSPLVAVVLLLLPASGVRADALIVPRAMTASSIAEFFVGETAVRVELEIGLGDLPAFRNLLPDPVFERLGQEPEPLARRLPRFFAQDLVLRADGGSPLPGRVLEMGPRPRVVRDEITGEALAPGPDPPETVVFAVLEYPLPGRPAVLSILPPRGGGGVPSPSIGFVTYHRNLPVNDFRYLGAEVVLDLDWQDPWYSRFRGRNLRRRYDAPMNAFLYVEPYEVRIEIITRPRDLQHWTDLGLDGLDTIPVARQQEIERRAAEFLAAQIEVSVDGEPAVPTLDRVHFLRRTLRTSRVIDPREDLDAISATLGVIFVVPTLALPQEATLTWQLFSDRIQRIPGAATDEAGPLPSFLDPDDNVLRWQNFLKHPTLPELVEVRVPPSRVLARFAGVGWVALLALLALGLRAAAAWRQGRRPGRAVLGLASLLLCVAIAAPLAARRARVDETSAREILGAVLHNVYRAFDFRDEGRIYDVLARSVSGDLLRQTYLETRRGLVLASQGGARAKVKEVSLVSVEASALDGGPGFRARCTWNVRGSVGHWGHIHERTNQYEAELTLQPVDGAWKITELELLQEERV